MKVIIFLHAEEDISSENFEEKFRKTAAKIRFILCSMRVVKLDREQMIFEGDDDCALSEDQSDRIRRVLDGMGFDKAEIIVSGGSAEVAAAAEDEEVEEDTQEGKEETKDGEDDGIDDAIDEILKEDEDKKDKLKDEMDDFAKSIGLDVFGKDEDSDDDDDDENEGEEDGEEESGKPTGGLGAKLRFAFGDREEPDDEENDNENSEPEEKETFGSVQRRISDLKEELSKRVKGQQHAIDAFVRAYFGAEVLVEKDHKGPLATFLFAGPPGCGKTYLSECASEFLKDRKYARFNMSEYNDFGASVNGSEFGGRAGTITQFVKNNPRCIVLFDEIEKASQNNLKLFLQILDAGVIRDLGSREDVSFKDAILIFTTNVARNLYEDADGSNLSGITKSAIISAIESDVNPVSRKPYFPKELVSRWAKGTVVLFNRLEPYAVKEIVLKELKNRIKIAEENTGIEIDCDYDKVASLIMYSVGGSGDARTMVGAVTRFMESELFDAVSQLTRRKMDVDKLRKIVLRADYAKSPVSYLFEVKDKVSVLFATEKKYARQLRRACAETGGVKAVFRSDSDSVKEAFRGEVGAVVLDVFLKERNAADRPSDLEDIESEGVALFEYITAKYPEIPVYLLNDEDKGYDDVAFDTFLARGAKGIVHFRHGEDEVNVKSLVYVRDATVTGNNFYKLSGSSNVLSYNCAQDIEKDGEELHISVRRFAVKRSVRAEDRESVVADVSRPSEKFSDVIGSEEVKKAMAEYVRYLKNPKKYTASGRKAPKGILLYGPPGTGKTMLAKALAGETDVTFIEKNATEFFKKYVGEGPESMRELFRTARRYAPSIVFIDEVDGFARARTGSEFTHVSEELLTTFLSEMEGFRSNENKPVILLCATNYGIKAEGDGDNKVLDPAFVRRFDKKILVGLPDTEDRRALIRHYLRQNGVDPDGLEDGISILAKKTIGYSHSAIKDIVLAVIERAEGGHVSDDMLQEAQDFEEHGEQKEYSKESVLRTARHEAGHAIVSWACGNMPAYMTVVARGPYGGYMMNDTEDDGDAVDTRQDMLDRVCCLLGGRAAELVFYGEKDGLTTGASSDLIKATKTAAMIIGSWGMAENRLAVASCFGDAVEKDIYNEVNALMHEELNRAKRLISENREAVEKLVIALAERNSLDSKDMLAILGEPSQKRG